MQDLTPKKAKRPVSIWITQLVLLLMATASGFSLFEAYQKLSEFSVAGMMWTSFQQWFDGLTSIGSLVAFIGLCFRWRFSRWLAFIVLSVNAAMGTYTFFRAGPPASISVVSSLLAVTIVILPLVVLALWLVISTKVKVFFGLVAPPLPDELLPSPPQPPTFEKP